MKCCEPKSSLNRAQTYTHHISSSIGLVQYLNICQQKLGTIILSFTVHILSHDGAVTGSLPEREYCMGNPIYFQIAWPSRNTVITLHCTSGLFHNGPGKKTIGLHNAQPLHVTYEYIAYFVPSRINIFCHTIANKFQ
jgi:hypothetical protein